MAGKFEELAGTASTQGKFISGRGLVDGQILPAQPLALFGNGRFNHMPLMNGNTADETNFGLAITEYFSNTDNARRAPPTAEQYLNYVNTTYTRQRILTAPQRKFWPSIRSARSRARNWPGIG